MKKKYLFSLFLICVSPTNAKYTHSRSSYNLDVASVSSNGVVTAQEKGMTVVRVTTDNRLSDYCTVTVPPNPERVELVERISLLYGKSRSLAYTIYPSDAYVSLSWSSSNPEVVRVADGRVKAIGVGEANITVTAPNGVKAVCRINVPEPDYHIFVWHYDGSYDAFSFSEHPIITCDGRTVKVVTSVTEIEFAETDVHKYTFSDSEEPFITEIGSVSDDSLQPRMEYKNDRVWIQGCIPGSVLQVFTMDGRTCGTRKVSINGRVEFNFSGLPIGIYILKTETITYKIIKK